MKKISASGVFKDLSIRDYHANPTVGVSISSTVLRAVENYSPRHGWFASHLNPERDFNPAKHFRIGTALHALAFEGTLDKADFVVSPYADFRPAEARAWRDRRIAEGKHILKAADVDTIKEMLDALLEEPLIKAGLFDSRSQLECSVILKDAETGLFIKARPDAIPSNPILVDLKSTADARRRSVERAILDYGYHMQLALAGEVIEKVIGTKIETYAFVFVESAPPYGVTICELDADYIAWGRAQNRRSLRRFAECVAKGTGKEHFPKYEHGELLLSAPPWMVERLTKEQGSGMLPSFADALN